MHQANLATASGATITVLPTTTLFSYLPPGSTLPPGGSFTSESSGAFYVSSSTPTPSGNAPSNNTGGDACICYTCALTPTIVPGCTNGPAPDYGNVDTMPPVSRGTCTPRPGTGTTTMFATTTITSCGVGSICPAPGYVIGGGNTTRSGDVILSTTDKNGNSVTYTQIPNTSPASTTRTSGGGGGPPATTPGTGENPLPTCPYADNTIFTSPMGNLYSVSCNMLFTNEVLERRTSPSLATCINLCDMFNTLSFMIPSPCLGVSWYSNQAEDNCLLKAGSTGVYHEGVWSARLVTPYQGPGGGNGTGPGGNGTGVTTVIGGYTTVTAPPVVSTYISNGQTVVQTVTGPGGGPGEYKTWLERLDCSC